MLSSHSISSSSNWFYFYIIGLLLLYWDTEELSVDLVAADQPPSDSVDFSEFFCCGIISCLSELTACYHFCGQ